VIRIEATLQDQLSRQRDFLSTVVRIGRHRDNDLSFDGRDISAHHGEIRLSTDGLIYRDLHSTNGSVVRRNGVAIPVDAACEYRVRLERGDDIELGVSSAPRILRVSHVESDEAYRAAGGAQESVFDVRESLEATSSEALTSWSQNFNQQALLAVYEFTAACSHQRDIDELLDHFGATTIGLLRRAHRLSVYMCRSSDDEFMPVLVRDRGGPCEAESLSRSLRKLMFGGGRAVIFDVAVPGCDGFESLGTWDMQTGLCAPLWDGEQVIGMAQVDARGLVPPAFGLDDLKVFTVLCYQLALAVENSRFTQGIQDSFRALTQAHSEMERLAFYDPLTGLYNRRLFRDRIEHAVRQMHRTGRRLALLSLDLDNFKHVNDTLGHDAGDLLLNVLSQRLRECVREQDTVARLGGDEFGILLIEAGGVEGAMTIADKLVKLLRLPVEIQGNSLVVSTSIGITIAPDDGTTAETLLKNADLALYRAKARGRDNFQFFIDDMNREASDRLFLGAEIRDGLAQAQFVHRFQPVLDLRQGAVIGAEALIRWNHPHRGFLAPADFVPFAEECGLIVPLGYWGALDVCTQLAVLQRSGYPRFRLAVNLSGRQFREPNLVEMFERHLEATGADANGLQVEITETMLIDDMRTSREVLERLREFGISVAIDDFGTGYSSLRYLNELPIDTLKIDRSFVNKISANSCHSDIAAAVIAMAHKLKKTVVAEGIESPEQLAFLKANECDYGQGYLFGAPMELDDVVRTMKFQRRADRRA
jgi:diguanylate cyclase (GGDEF)-like protein